MASTGVNDLVPEYLCQPCFVAGWSSPVARQAHNLKVAGSNPAPATKNYISFELFAPPRIQPGGVRFLDLCLVLAKPQAHRTIQFFHAKTDYNNQVIPYLTYTITL